MQYARKLIHHLLGHPASEVVEIVMFGVTIVQACGSCGETLFKLEDLDLRDHPDYNPDPCCS